MEWTKEKLAELFKEIALEQGRILQSDYDAKIAALKEVFVKKPTGDVDPRGGFKSFADFAYNVAKSYGPERKTDDRLKEISKAFGDAVIAEDGWPLPTEYRNQFIEMLIETSGILQRCTPIPMAVNSVTLPVMDSTTITTYWIGEGTRYTDSEPTTDSITMTLGKLTSFAIVNSELLEDSPISLEPVLQKMFTNKMTLALEDAILNGNGATNKPTGVYDSGNTALITVAKESGQTNNTVVEDNILKVYDQQKNKSAAVWVLPQTSVLTQIMKINRSISTAGGCPLYVPTGGLSAAPYGTILGQPIVFSDAAKALGVKGDLGFVDFSNYFIGQKAGKGLVSDTSLHLRFDYDQMCFRWTWRVTGKPGLKTPYTLSTAAEVSPFVVLAARS